MSTPRRFRPGAWDALEERVVLSTTAFRAPLDRVALAGRFRELAAARAAARQVPTPARPALAHRLAPQVHATPSVVIDQRYDAFEADIAEAAVLYLRTLAQGASRVQDVTITLTAPYQPGDNLFFVDVLDFPPPTAAAPLLLTAPVLGGSVLFRATGAAPGVLTGVLPYNPAIDDFGGVDAPDVFLPAGTVLRAQIPLDQGVVGDVATQYLAYVTQRTLALSEELVTYFNRLPIRLPRLPGPYHTERPQTAIQFYLANQIAGQGPQILLQQLTSLPLPTSTGAAVDLYVATALSVINSSQEQVREGVRLLFAGRSIGSLLPVIPTQT